MSDKEYKSRDFSRGWARAYGGTLIHFVERKSMPWTRPFHAVCGKRFKIIWKHRTPNASDRACPTCVRFRGLLGLRAHERAP